LKLLTFFGIANYSVTIYRWNDLEVMSPYSSIASCDFLKPDQLLVFLTKEAKENEHYGKMIAAVPGSIEILPVTIPLGKDEPELWEIFQTITSYVAPGEDVAFDITNGLRSFPLVGFLAAAFLRSSFHVNLKAVLYGAFDVGRARGDGITPVFDLSPMLELLDWAEGADRFNRTGDSRFLASLLKKKHGQLGKQSQKDPARLAAIKPLSDLSATLENLSEATRFIRPLAAIDEAAKVDALIEQSRPELMTHDTTAPFSLLLENIRAGYQPFAGITDASVTINVKVSLQHQLALIAWYIEREYWVQAITLCREWLVSWTMLQMCLTEMVNKDDRSRVENALNSLAHHSNQDNPDVIALSRRPDAKAIMKLWKTTTDIRNDIDHAGMRPGPASPTRLKNQIQKIHQQLIALPIDSSQEPA